MWMIELHNAQSNPRHTYLAVSPTETYFIRPTFHWVSYIRNHLLYSTCFWIWKEENLKREILPASFLLEIKLQNGNIKIYFMFFFCWGRSTEFAGWRSHLTFFKQKNRLNIFEINEYTHFLLPTLQRIEHCRAAHIWYHLFIYQNTEAVQGKKAGT